MTDEELFALVREIADPETEDPVNDGLITLTLPEMHLLLARVYAEARSNPYVLKGSWR